MKKCSFCAEEIQDEAIKCRYCGEKLVGENSQSLSDDKEKLKSKQPNSNLSWIDFFLLFLSGGAIFLSLLFPPYFHIKENGFVTYLGYHLIFDPPKRGTINYIHLIIQISLITIVALAIWVILKKFAFKNTQSNYTNSIETKIISPWHRLFARSIDYAVSVFAAIIIYISMNAFGGLASNFWINVIQQVMLFISTIILLEAISLLIYSTTIGKAIFGILVVSEKEQRLVFSECLKRSLYALSEGYLFFFPAITWMSQYYAYSVIKKTGKSNWDKRLGLKLIQSNIGPFRKYFGILCGLISIVGLNSYFIINKQINKELLREYFREELASVKAPNGDNQKLNENNNINKSNEKKFAYSELLASLDEIERKENLKNQKTSEKAKPMQQRNLDEMLEVFTKIREDALKAEKIVVEAKKESDPHKALNLLNQAISLHQGNHEAYLARAEVYSNLNRKSNALNDLNEAERLKNNDPLIYFYRGSLFFDLGQYEFAIADFNKTIQYNPQFAIAYYNRGLSYEKAGKQELAIRDFNTAIKLNPSHSLFYLARGNSFGKLKEYKKAIADLNKTIEIDKNNRLAYKARGNLLMENNNFREGCKDLLKACNMGDCEYFQFAQKEGFCK